eukprot:scaffold2761_cov391-Prasinococcus_capsulatus_cf.AAC.1
MNVRLVPPGAAKPARGEEGRGTARVYIFFGFALSIHWLGPSTAPSPSSPAHPQPPGGVGEAGPRARPPVVGCGG